MRLWLKVEDSVTRRVVDRRILYSVPGDVKTIEELTQKLAKDLGVSGQLTLSLNGYTVFAKSPIDIINDGTFLDLAQRQESPPTLKTIAASEARSSTTSKELPESSTNTASSSTASDSSASSDTDSSSKESSPRQKSAAVNGDVSAVKDSSEEEDTSEETTETSDPESSESSEESNVIAASSESKEKQRPQDKPENPSTKWNSGALRPLPSRTSLPADPLPSWKRSGTVPSVGDVVMYRIIDISPSWTPVAVWRYGTVETVTAQSGSSALLCLAPWPDASRHPDPKYIMAKAAQEEEPKNNDRQTKYIRTLEVPNSQYREDGRLVQRLGDFIDMRFVDRITVEQYQPKETASENGQTQTAASSKRKKRENREKKTQHKHMVKKRGMAGFLDYVKSNS